MPAYKSSPSIKWVHFLDMTKEASHAVCLFSLPLPPQNPTQLMGLCGLQNWLVNSPAIFMNSFHGKALEKVKKIFPINTSKKKTN